MSGHIRVVMIEAEGEAAARAIEMALQALAPARGAAVVASLAPGAMPAMAAPIAAERLAPPSPARSSSGKRATKARRVRAARAEPARAAEPGPASPPAAASPVREPTAADQAQLVEGNGIAVAGTSISYGGKTITLTPREAQLAATLAKVSPSLLDPDRIARAVWNKPRADVQALIYQACSTLNAAVQAIGLRVHTERGIGVALVPA